MNLQYFNICRNKNKLITFLKKIQFYEKDWMRWKVTKIYNNIYLLSIFDIEKQLRLLENKNFSLKSNCKL